MSRRTRTRAVRHLLSLPLVVLGALATCLSAHAGPPESEPLTLWSLGTDGLLRSNPESEDDERTFELLIVSADGDPSERVVTGGVAMTADPTSNDLFVVLVTEPAGGGPEREALYSIDLRPRNDLKIEASELCETWPVAGGDRLTSIAFLGIENEAGILYGVSAFDGNNPNALYRLGAPKSCALEFVELLENSANGDSSASRPALEGEEPTLERLFGLSAKFESLIPGAEPPFREQIFYQDPVPPRLKGLAFKGDVGADSVFLATGVASGPIGQLLEVTVTPGALATVSSGPDDLDNQATGIAIRSAEASTPYSVSQLSNKLFKLDTAMNPIDTEVAALTLNSEVPASSVEAATALTRQGELDPKAPDDLLVVLGIEDRFSDRELARITFQNDLPDPQVTTLGSVSRLAGLAVGTLEVDGSDTPTLFGVVGDNQAGGGVARLVTLDLTGSSAVESSYVDLGAGGRGEAIAWAPTSESSGRILHASGDGDANEMSDGQILEWIDPQGMGTPINLTGESVSVPTALTYVPLSNPQDDLQLMAAENSLRLLQLSEDSDDPQSFTVTSLGFLSQVSAGLAYSLPEPAGGSTAALATLFALAALVARRRSTLRS